MSASNEKIVEELRNIDKRLDTIGIVQAEQAKDIKYHISRTDKLQLLTEDVYKWKQQFVGASKLVGFLALVLGLFKLIVELQ